MNIKKITSVMLTVFLASCAGQVKDVLDFSSSANGTARAYIPAADGIYMLELNTATGQIESHVLNTTLKAARFLTIHPSDQYLYVARMEGKWGEGSTGAAVAYSIDKSSGQLTTINEQYASGQNSAFIETNRTGDMAIVANYNGATVSTFKIGEDGALSEHTQIIEHTGATGLVLPKQSVPHPHSARVSPENTFVYIPDLGTDDIWIYRIDKDTATLVPAETPQFSVKDGSGPRHFDFHPSANFAYLISEISAEVTVFSRNAENGELTEVQKITTLPDDFEGRKYAAEIKVHPNGKFLYVSNRVHDSIAVFQVDQRQGTLKQVEYEPSLGKIPRHFDIDPTGRWLVVGNQKSNTVVVFAINQYTGELDPVGEPVEIADPRAVAFLSNLVEVKSEG